jgi:hypothetical protein
MERHPSESQKLCINPCVSCAIRIDLGLPEVRSGFGKSEQMAAVTMPETSIDEDCRGMARKNQVGAARQTRPSQPIPQTLRMKCAADQQLKFRVRATDPRHLRGPLLRS